MVTEIKVVVVDIWIYMDNPIHMLEGEGQG